MPKTAPRISLGLYGLEIKRDSTPSAMGLQPFSKVDDLKRDNVSAYPYASYEPDFWLLDGGYKFKPEDNDLVHVGFMSMAMSGDDGNFDVEPVLTVNFGSAHDTDGLVLRFSPYSGDYASSFRAQYYDSTNALIREDTYAPTSAEFSVAQPVSGFKKLVLTFYATNRAYRYLRLTGIDFGLLLYLEDEDIISAAVVEDTDMLSAQARINTFDLTVISPDSAFSVFNPNGYANNLQQRQPLTVYERVDDGVVYLGQYYLDKWTHKSETQIAFHCVDLLGVLDTITYRGAMLSGVLLQTLIANLLDPIYVQYDLDIDLYNIPVSGWIKAGSYRQALQQIAFAVGAYLDCSRSGVIQMHASRLASASAEYDADLSSEDQSMAQSLTLKLYVTGVEVTAHNYVAVTTSRQVFNNALAVGQHEIAFPEPLHDLSVSGATIVESGVNYAIVNVTTAGTVTLSGQTYLDTNQSITVSGAVSAGVKPNVLKVVDATLVNSANAQAVAQRVYDYHQQRYLQKLKLFAPAVRVGDAVLVESLYGQYLRCVIEKMSINLSGGFVADVEMTGVQHAIS